MTQTDMIEVDGVRRSRINSQGKLIHSSDEGIINFWRWFGDSKVIDELGRPVVVYHGTKKTFDVFNTPSLFLDKKQVSDMLPADCGSSERSDDFKVMPVYLKISSPFKTSDWCDIERCAYSLEWVGDRKSMGFDGIIFEDSSGIDYIAFDQNQIKSSAGNSGGFDPSSSNIYDA